MQNTIDPIEEAKKRAKKALDLLLNQRQFHWTEYDRLFENIDKDLVFWAIIERATRNGALDSIPVWARCMIFPWIEAHDKIEKRLGIQMQIFNSWEEVKA